MFSCRRDIERRNEIMKEFHDNLIHGHRSASTVEEKIRTQGFVWEGMHDDIRNFVKSCEKCQKVNINQRTKMEMEISDSPKAPMEKISIDIVGKMHMSGDGNEYILTVMSSVVTSSHSDQEA